MPSDYVVFAGGHAHLRGELDAVIPAAQALFQAQVDQPVLIFAIADGSLIRVDLAAPGDLAEAQARSQVGEQGADPQSTKSDRTPIAHEVRLLPRHWAYLERQPNGVSASLRRLIDRAIKTQVHADRARAAQDACYRFLSAIAGDLPGYEACLRALYAADLEQMEVAMHAWSPDIRELALTLAQDISPAFSGSSASGKNDA